MPVCSLFSDSLFQGRGLDCGQMETPFNGGFIHGRQFKDVMKSVRLLTEISFHIAQLMPV